MELLNEFTSNLSSIRKDLQAYVLQRFAVMLAVLAPHLAEECWHLLGNNKSIFEEPYWYNFDPFALSQKTKIIVVQINGKVRSKLEVPTDFDELAVKKEVWDDAKVKSYTDGKQLVKEIYVPNKIYNIVVK